MVDRHGHDCVECGKFFECLCNSRFGVKRDLCDLCLEAILGPEPKTRTFTISDR
jgi:hypothetical protein